MSSHYDTVVLGDSPVAFLPLDETSGTTANDASGNGHNGTYEGGYTLGETGIGDGETAVLFNGSTGYVTVPDASALRPGTGPFSIECWMKTTASGSQTGVLVSKQTDGGDYHGYWLANSNSGSDFGSGTGIATTVQAGGQQFGHETAASVVTQTWHHIVMTWAGGAVLPLIYVDGTSRTVTDDGSSGSPDVTNTDPLVIGTWNDFNGAAPFSGLIAKVAIYDAALTSTQVANHYAAASASAASGNFLALMGA